MGTWTTCKPTRKSMNHTSTFNLREVRWPFGPPHLTLKPSKKNKNNKKQEQKNKKQKHKKQKHNKNQHQNKSNNKAKTKQTKQKQKQHKKTNTNTRNTKPAKPSKPKINKNKPPHTKAPKNGKKIPTSIFNTSGTMPDIPKTNHNNIKTSKQTQKHHFAMFKNNPQFFINFLFFNIQLFKNTVSKTHFFTHVKKTPFQRKRCHFWFWAISAETTIFIAFPGLHCFGQKKLFCQNR